MNQTMRMEWQSRPHQKQRQSSFRAIWIITLVDEHPRHLRLIIVLISTGYLEAGASR